MLHVACVFCVTTHLILEVEIFLTLAALLLSARERLRIALEEVHGQEEGDQADDRQDQIPLLGRYLKGEIFCRVVEGEGGRVGVRIGVAGGAGGTGYGWRRNCLCASGYG